MEYYSADQNQWLPAVVANDKGEMIDRESMLVLVLLVLVVLVVLLLLLLLLMSASLQSTSGRSPEYPV